jgi:hypothetical protein
VILINLSYTSYNIKMSLTSGWNVQSLYSYIPKSDAWVHLYSHFITVLSSALLGGRKTTIFVQFTSPNLFIYTPPFSSLFSFFSLSFPTFALLLVSNFVENSSRLDSVTNLRLQIVCSSHSTSAAISVSKPLLL